jgi:hypothetical protein
LSPGSGAQLRQPALLMGIRTASRTEWAPAFQDVLLDQPGTTCGKDLPHVTPCYWLAPVTASSLEGSKRPAEPAATAAERGRPTPQSWSSDRSSPGERGLNPQDLRSRADDRQRNRLRQTLIGTRWTHNVPLAQQPKPRCAAEARRPKPASAPPDWRSGIIPGGLSARVRYLGQRFAWKST